MSVDPRTPVLVGVGVAHQRAEQAGAGDEAVELMVRAARAAGDDAGAPALLGHVERIAVPNGTWGYTDPGRLVGARIGSPGATTVLVELGIPQQTLVSDALRRIAAGEIDVALVVGGETKHRATLAQRAGTVAPETDQGGAAPDEHLHPEGEVIATAEVQAGAWSPVQQYALIDSALRHAEGRSLDEHRDEIAALWEGFNAVAAGNPHAAFPERRDAGFLREPGPGNRLLAFPYNKWHSTQWAVDQAAALLLCSAGTAEAHGVPGDRWLFPLVALESSHSLSLSRRRHLHRWPAMAVLGEVAEHHLGRPLADVAHVELYSCFPVAVRVQQRELGLALDGVPTITGGMAFAGGPFNSFTYQATAAMADRLRAAPGTLGLLTTVSGLLTKPGLVVWSTEPGERPSLVADLGEDAASATPVVDVVDRHDGTATVAAVTVTPNGDTPERVVVIADTPGGARCVATAVDRGLAERAMREELVGTDVVVRGHTFTPAVP